MVTRLCRTSKILAGGVLAGCALSACGNGSLGSFFGGTDEKRGEIERAAPPPSTPAAPSLAARLALPPATSKVPAEERAAHSPPRSSADRDARATLVPVVPAPVISVAGLTEAEVLSVMGEPQQRSERGGRKIWTYTGAGCRVEVTFFREVTGGAYAALSQKVIGAGGAARETCERSVRSASR